MTDQITSTAETKEDLASSPGDTGKVEIWLKEIENAQGHQETWIAEGDKYLDIYRDQHNNTIHSDGLSDSQRYNIFWANTETLKPLVYSRLPAPNVTRRFADNKTAIDDLTRIASEMMEIALSYFLEKTKASKQFKQARNDYLITGRGVARVIIDGEDVVEVGKKEEEDKEGNVTEVPIEDVDPSTKKVRVEYVPWDEILLSPEKTWESLRWLAFKHKMTRIQLVDKFGKTIGNAVALDSTVLTHTDSKKEGEDHEIFKVAEVWEIWDETEKKIVWVSTGHKDGLLSDEEDNYNLQEFFPVPRLLGSESDPSSLLPIPLYRMYKAQAEELNRLEVRTSSLTDQLKATDVYATSVEGKDVENLMDGVDGEISPMTGVQPGTDISKSIFFKPLDTIAGVIERLENRKIRIINNIRDITGLSDIVRGTTVASETARAQELKGNFAISRIQPAQDEVSEFIKGIYNLSGELIVENFSIEELAKITSLKVIDIDAMQAEFEAQQEKLKQEAIALLDPKDQEIQQKIQLLEEQKIKGIKALMSKPLSDLKGFAVRPDQLKQIDALIKDDQARNFLIDIETDSTVRIDESKDKQDRLEYAQAISTFITNFTPILQIGAISKTAFNEMLSFISKPFKVGRNLEEFLLEEEEANPEPEEPSVDEQLAQAENARKDKKIQLEEREVDIKQQEVDVKKANAKIGMEEFNDKLEFDDVNKAADREAKTIDQVIQDGTKQIVQQIANTNLGGQ